MWNRCRRKLPGGSECDASHSIIIARDGGVAMFVRSPISASPRLARSLAFRSGAKLRVFQLDEITDAAACADTIAVPHRAKGPSFAPAPTCVSAIAVNGATC